jgi:hypothetical protein
VDEFDEFGSRESRLIGEVAVSAAVEVVAEVVEVQTLKQY